MSGWYERALFYAQGAIDARPGCIVGTMSMQDATVFAELYEGARSAVDNGHAVSCDSLPHSWEKYRNQRRRVHRITDTAEFPRMGTTVVKPFGGWVTVRFDDSQALELVPLDALKMRSDR